MCLEHIVWILTAAEKQLELCHCLRCSDYLTQLTDHCVSSEKQLYHTKKKKKKPVCFPKLLWNKWECWQKSNSTLRPGEMLWKQPNDQSRVFLQVKWAFPTSLIICCSCQRCFIWSLFPGRSTFETHARPSYLFTCTQVFLGLLHWWNKYSVMQQYCTYVLRHFLGARWPVFRSKLHHSLDEHELNNLASVFLQTPPLPLVCWDCKLCVTRKMFPSVFTQQPDFIMVRLRVTI